MKNVWKANELLYTGISWLQVFLGIQTHETHSFMGHSWAQYFIPAFHGYSLPMKNLATETFMGIHRFMEISW